MLAFQARMPDRLSDPWLLLSTGTGVKRLLKHQVVAVTGASSGIGRAIAREFGRRSARVALLARTPLALEDTAEEIRRAGGDGFPIPLDISDALAVEKAAAAIIERWGHIDIWINDAMVSVFSPIWQMKPDEYRRVTEVNYLGTVYGTLAALKHMRARDEGLIIQIGSALAYRSIPLQSAYCASKAAIRGFTDSLRTELLHDKSRIRIYMLQLPAVNTPQFDVVRSRLPRQAQPVPPIFQPELIARAAVYVAQRRRPPRELWIAGSTIKAIIAQKLLPGLADRYLAKTGYESQQTTEPAVPRPDNVDAPILTDRGAHGRFDTRARLRSLELWLRMHRGWVAGLACLCALALTRQIARRGT